MFKKISRLFGGDSQKREIEKMLPLVEQINALEAPFEAISDEALRGKTDEFRQRLADGETLDDLLPEAFATVREASKRTIGKRPFDVQLLGGMILHQGKIVEMRTGEGKTLIATLPLYLNALTGRGAHLVTVNDYLARRDARRKGPIYNMLGLSVGVLQMAARTENGKRAFLVDLERTSPREDQHQLRMVDRAEAYRADITYGTNNEFGFDFLRDNLTMSLADRVQHAHAYAIIDEVDNILIDEARTPLIISGPSSEDTEWYLRMAQLVRQLRPEDYEINERDRQVSLTEIGEAHMEELLDMPLRDPERPEDISPEQARVLGYLEQALRAQHLFRRNKDYIVQAGKVIIVDEFTGRLMPGRRWSEGLHQAIEAKEGARIEPENVTYATITIQNYFRMYDKLAGMTGTAMTESEEFGKTYKLDVLQVPTNLDYIASSPNSNLMVVSAKDAEGYPIEYYARPNDPQHQPIFWRRTDYPDIVYRTQEAKLRAITLEVLRFHAMGRPMLIGTTSVEHSELISSRFQAESLRRAVQTFLIRQSWMDKHHIELVEREIPELDFLNKPLETINIGEMRKIARTAGMASINPEDPENLSLLLRVLPLDAQYRERLLKVLQGGMPHQVLNARKHDEESAIIARAGAFGAITIATNMAGRGVDIKLGGELSEEVIADVVRVLRRAGVQDPYELDNQERRKILLEMDASQFGIYEEAVQTFLQYLDHMEQVRLLGGLHVIGSERHEARRIDNQLRGRSARQGDPGSSRFYLSMEDDLMRLFGGQQMESLMDRLRIDPSMPIEVRMIGRMVEQSQERVEGSNFDVRKHLLEYDDVLNMQRKRIYAERDRAFTKLDLQDDILALLNTELQNRIPLAIKDEESPWKLVAYLEEIQPTMFFEQEGVMAPSYPLRLVINDLRSVSNQLDSLASLKNALLNTAGRAIDHESRHLLKSVRELLDRSEQHYEQTVQERHDAIDTFVEGMSDRSESEDEEGQPRRPQDLLQELSELVRIPLKLSPDQLRAFAEGDAEIKPVLKSQVDSSLAQISTTRLVGSLERRLNTSLDFRPDMADSSLPWTEISDQFYNMVEGVLEKRTAALLGENGQITQNLENFLNRAADRPIDDRMLTEALMVMTLGTRLAIDPRTHRRGWRRITLFSYVHLAAHLLQELPVEEITENILTHLVSIQKGLQLVWGMEEFMQMVHAQMVLSQLDAGTTELLAEELGADELARIADIPPAQFSPGTQKQVALVLGRRVQNETYRRILVGVFSDLWVDYLTSIEALRVSIGLEAYAQRDPLVQYKRKASEMFSSLLADIRMGVISRMFVTIPRRGAQTQASVELPVSPVETQPGEAPQASQAAGKKKRRRH